MIIELILKRDNGTIIHREQGNALEKLETLFTPGSTTIIELGIRTQILQGFQYSPIVYEPSIDKWIGHSD